MHGPNGFDSPSEGLLRGVEFVATWFSYVIASQEEGGAVPKPNRPIAYFETTPKKPTAQTTVSFDAGFSRKADGKANGLTYYWDFGDGSPLAATTDPLIQHTFPTQAAWRDVKLLVGGRKTGTGARSGSSSRSTSSRRTTRRSFRRRSRPRLRAGRRRTRAGRWRRTSRPR